MARGRIKMSLKLKLKRKGKGRDLTEKKVRLLCDFCGFYSNNSYEQSPHAHEQAVLSMESQLKRLRLVTRRMTCQDLHGLTFTELMLLETHLSHVLLVVTDRKKNLEDQVPRTQTEDGGIGTRRQVLVPCSSSGERQDQQVGQAPPLFLSKAQIEFERRRAESVEMKVERLWLLKERMNGRELDGMNSAELRLLESQIRTAVGVLRRHRLSPAIDQFFKKLQG